MFGVSMAQHQRLTMSLSPCRVATITCAEPTHTMDDQTHLTKEIRAAREEKIRKERQHGSRERGGLTPPRNPAFQRLRTLSTEELTAHIERLERDIEDLNQEVETQADDPGGNQ